MNIFSKWSNKFNKMKDRTEHNGGWVSVEDEKPMMLLRIFVKTICHGEQEAWRCIDDGYFLFGELNEWVPQDEVTHWRYDGIEKGGFEKDCEAYVEM